MNSTPIGPHTDWDQHEAVTREGRQSSGTRGLEKGGLAKCSKLDLSGISGRIVKLCTELVYLVSHFGCLGRILLDTPLPQDVS